MNDLETNLVREIVRAEISRREREVSPHSQVYGPGSYPVNHVRTYDIPPDSNNSYTPNHVPYGANQHIEQRLLSLERRVGTDNNNYYNNPNNLSVRMDMLENANRNEEISRFTTPPSLSMTQIINWMTENLELRVSMSSEGNQIETQVSLYDLTTGKEVAIDNDFIKIETNE